MGYPFVPARYDYGIRKGPALALVLHMAEGGNTVRYLAGSPERGVSVHFVAEYSGRIVQMLPLDHASGSINPAQLRTTDDAHGPYGASSARAVLGSWYVDPNSATITMEIEGFAKDGPNALQGKAIRSWCHDMQLVLPKLAGALGHRDFQDYKPCPGQKVDWNIVDGHGPWHGAGPIEEEPMQTFPAYDVPHLTDLPAGTKLYADSDFSSIRETLGAPRTLPYLGSYTAPGKPVAHIVVHGSVAEYLKAADLPAHPYPAPTTDCTAAVAAEHERTRQQAIDAVTAIP